MHERCTTCACLLSVKLLVRHAPSLQVLEGMGEEHARMVLAASGSCVGERAWLLPARLHPLDPDITTVRPLTDTLMFCMRLQHPSTGIPPRVTCIAHFPLHMHAACTPSCSQERMCYQCAFMYRLSQLPGQSASRILGREWL